MKNVRSALLDLQHASATRESFAWTHAAIIIGIHLLAIGGYFFVTAESVILFVASHYFFYFFGMTLGFHRLLSHNSYLAKGFWRNIFATLGTLCFQGGPLFWAAVHREHHARNEGPGDAHSARRGFWWSHMGWLFYRSPNGFSYVKAQRLIPDLARSRFLRGLERNAVRLNVFVLAGGALLAGLCQRWDLFFWIGPVRILSVWHSTWLLNSYAHGARIFGGQPTGLRNSILINLLFPGEGMHKNHHDWPNSPSNSRKWYELDPAYWLLLFLQRLGAVKLPLKNNRMTPPAM